MITSLSKEQEAQIPIVREWWIRRAIRENWDMDQARVAAIGAYNAASLSVPKFVFTVENPIQALFIIGVFKKIHAFDLPVFKEFVKAHRSKRPFKTTDPIIRLVKLIFDVGGAWKKVVTPIAMDRFRSKLDEKSNKLIDLVGLETLTTIGEEFARYIRDNIDSKFQYTEWTVAPRPTQKDCFELVKDLFTSKLTWISPCDGAGWCCWRAFYDYFFRIFGLAEKLQPYIEIDKSGAFWWWLYKDIAVLIGPPKFSFDQGNFEGEAYRLHRADGPAVAWPMGVDLFFWRGLAVPGEWIKDRPVGARLKEIWANERNQELKRALHEIVGPEELLTAIGAKVVQRDGSGELVQADLGDDNGRPAKYLCVKCPSGREYYIRTSPETKSCIEGLARSANVSVKEYTFQRQA